MKKVFQDKDNCLDACLATLLGVKLKTLPVSRALDTDKEDKFWIQKLNDWLIKKHKSRLIYADKQSILINIGCGYNKPFILVITGDYAPTPHAVIVDSSLKIIHDPANPSHISKSFTELYGLEVKTDYALFLTKD